jgi:hypothetical protein
MGAGRGVGVGGDEGVRVIEREDGESGDRGCEGETFVKCQIEASIIAYCRPTTKMIMMSM